MRSAVVRPEALLTRCDSGCYTARIAAGELRIRTRLEEIPLGDALDFAARHNAKRRFLFVSRLLGRHLPTRPAELRDAAQRLAAKLWSAGLQQPCLFVGMAETATTLGQATFREWRRLGGCGLYVDSTRRLTGDAVAFRFIEAHSHATGHVIHEPSEAEDPEGVFAGARTLVIVDDEATTGRTALELASAYRAWRGEEGVPAHLAVLVRCGGSEGPTDGGMRTHALIEVEFEFIPEENFCPDADACAGSEARVTVLAPRGSRHGVRVPAEASDASDYAVSGGPVLVVGTGEFGYVPFCLAERFERFGIDAYVQATTRSPVMLGGAIRHIRKFPALTGEGYIEFLYNVPDDHAYSSVWICGEDGIAPDGHPIWEIPRVKCVSMVR